MDWPSLLNTSETNSNEVKVVNNLSENIVKKKKTNNNNNNSNNNNNKNKRKKKKKRITLTNMSPTITDKIISSGNISSPSILQSSSRPSSLSSSTIISPSNKSTNVIDLSKFEKRLSLSDDSNNNLSSSSVKITDRNWDNQDDTALKEEKDGIITHSNINIVLTSSPSNVTKNAIYTCKIKDKKTII